MNDLSGSFWTIDVTEQSFESDVVARSKEVPVVLDFWAEWCGPCKMLGPELERLAREYAGKFVLAKVDIDANQALASAFGIASIPTVVAVIDGQIANQFTGLLPKSQIVEFLSLIIPTEQQELVRKAAALEVTDPANAETLYRQALALDAESTVVLAALADLAVKVGRVEEARELVAKVGEGTDGADRANSVRDKIRLQDSSGSTGGLEDCKARVAGDPTNPQARLELGLAFAAAGKFEEALETLVQIVETDRDFGLEHVKAEMVKIFGIIGVQSELASRYRPRLARALY